MATSQTALQAGMETTNRLNERFDRLDVMGTVRAIGGAMIGIAVLVVVLNEVFSLSTITNSSGAFSNVISSLESTGAAALGLLVVGLLVLAANSVLGFFGGGGL